MNSNNIHILESMKDFKKSISYLKKKNCNYLYNIKLTYDGQYIILKYTFTIEANSYGSGKYEIGDFKSLDWELNKR